MQYEGPCGKPIVGEEVVDQHLEPLAVAAGIPQQAELFGLKLSLRGMLQEPEAGIDRRKRRAQVVGDRGDKHRAQPVKLGELLSLMLLRLRLGLRTGKLLDEGRGDNADEGQDEQTGRKDVELAGVTAPGGEGWRQGHHHGHRQQRIDDRAGEREQHCRGQQGEHKQREVCAGRLAADGVQPRDNGEVEPGHVGFKPEPGRAHDGKLKQSVVEAKHAECRPQWETHAGRERPKCGDEEQQQEEQPAELEERAAQG